MADMIQPPPRSPRPVKTSHMNNLKLEKLRIESEGNLARADKAEAEVRELKAEVARKETDVQNLNNKIKLLQMDLERTEKRVEEVKVKKAEGDKEDSQIEVLTRKVQLLEHQLEEKEKSWREATDKARSLEVHSEHHERKAKQIDTEKVDLEKKYEDLTARYNAVKAELEATLKSLEDL
ncbi:tropomyosin like-domain-containing protein [Obelidium mucronatum]|nr:tropomyosin like-domain-containing protein [Obelidium mucronatum]